VPVPSRLAGACLAAALALGASAGERAVPEHVWPVDAWIDFRLVDGQPEWPRRLLEKLALANADLQGVQHPLDVGCPVEIALASVRVYRAYEDGLIEGGSLPLETRAADGSVSVTSVERMPHDTLAQPSTRHFERTRLYVAPGPGWAHAREPSNVAYAWVGSWKPDSSNGRGGGTEGLIDPWGRPGGYVFVHELGHVAGLVHRVVTRPEQCSLMSYGREMFPFASEEELCPSNGSRFTADQCERLVAKARTESRTPLPLRTDVYRDGSIDGRDLETVRRIAAGRPESDHLPPCLDWQAKGPCRLFPIGDVDGDLRVDAADVALVERAVGNSK
jgi:hypothetical protein